MGDLEHEPDQRPEMMVLEKRMLRTHRRMKNERDVQIGGLGDNGSEPLVAGGSPRDVGESEKTLQAELLHGTLELFGPFLRLLHVDGSNAREAIRTFGADLRHLVVQVPAQGDSFLRAQKLSVGEAVGQDLHIHPGLIHLPNALRRVKGGLYDRAVVDPVPVNRRQAGFSVPDLEFVARAERIEAGNVHLRVDVRMYVDNHWEAPSTKVP